MGVVGAAFVAASISVSSILSAINDAPNLDPTVNLSAVRYIYCDDLKGNGGWTGSGSIVGKNVILTALHVANGKNCIDIGTGRRLVLYAADKEHDVAFMTGDTPDVPYIKMSCLPYNKGQTYIAFGISDYKRKNPLFRMNMLVADRVQKNVLLGDGTEIHDIEQMNGAVVPGMSGGPIVDAAGYLHGIVSIGVQDELGFPTKYSGSYELSVTSFCR